MGRTAIATNAGLVAAGLVASLYLWVRATGHGLPVPALPFVREQPEHAGAAAFVERNRTPKVRARARSAARLGTPARPASVTAAVPISVSPARRRPRPVARPSSPHRTTTPATRPAG